jgi:hypothetical protein
MIDNLIECNTCNTINNKRKFNQIFVILNEILPNHLCYSIIRSIHRFKMKCSNCKSKLCKSHSDLALARGLYFIGYGTMLCDHCDWDWII